MRLIALLFACSLALAPSARAADAFTANLGLVKPEAGSSADAWAPKLNSNADVVDGEYKVTSRGDANYTILSSDRFIVVTSTFTAARAFALPGASSHTAAQPVVIVDAAGAFSNTHPLDLSPAGADTLSGGSGAVFRDPYSIVVLRSDGVSRWTYSAPEIRGEGAWTPVLALGTPGSSSFSASNSGYWKRDGNRVTVTFAISFTPAVGTGAGNLEVTGLPFPAGAASYVQASGSLNQFGPNFTGLSMRPVVVPMMLSTTKLGFASWGIGAGTGTLGTANLTDGMPYALRGSLTYFIDP
jgi:hypothetical protein